LATPIMISDDGKKEPFRDECSEKEAKNVLEYFTNGLPNIIQMGGNATIGKGLIRTHYVNMEV